MTDPAGTGSKDTPGVITAPAIIYAAGLALGLLLDWAYHIPIFQPGSGGFFRGFLFGLGIIGIAVIIAAVLKLRAARTPIVPFEPTTSVVTGGPYARTRNPIYLSFVLLYLAAVGVLNSLWPLILLPIVIGVVQWGVILREEQYLERKFGAEYLAYRKRVRRWL